METPAPVPPLNLDALLPPEMADRAERIGIQKARLDIPSLLALSVLAGAFIGFGAMFSTVVAAGADGVLPFGVVRLLSGLAFSLGLILVIVGGAELFTGNNLMVMAWASGRLRTREMLRAWILVYIGNFVGALGTAMLVFLTDDYLHGGATVGVAALVAAQAKASLPMVPALVHGVLGNVLVCLAVWLCYSARTTTDRILAIVPPITAFVAAGFEHSVANMYLIPFGMMVKHGAAASFWTASGLAPDAFPALTLRGLFANLVPVTVGNIVGGGLLVGAVYWFVYLRRRRSTPDQS
jgi:formate transporter